jgi:hypothetical protein
VEIDSKLLQHGGLVLDHQDRRTEDVGGPVDLESGRQRRKPDLAVAGATGRSAVNAVVFQARLYTIIYNYSLP